MESKGAEKKEYVYVLVRYDDEEDCGVESVEVFKTANGAKNALINYIHEEFLACDGIIESDDFSDESSDENTTKKVDKSEAIPGFDERNWEHVKPIILKELEACKDGYWDYDNTSKYKYGFFKYMVRKTAVKA